MIDFQSAYPNSRKIHDARPARLTPDGPEVSLQVPLRAVPFAHGGWHRLPTGQTLASSFHTSRYNVNTGRLTEAMFDEVVARLAGAMAEPALTAAG